MEALWQNKQVIAAITFPCDGSGVILQYPLIPALSQKEQPVVPSLSPCKTADYRICFIIGNSK